MMLTISRWAWGIKVRWGGVHRRWSCHRRSGRFRSWNWLRVRLPDHRIRQEPLPEAAAVLLRHPGLRPLRSHGPVLPHDGFPPAVRLLGSTPLVPVVLDSL